ncbi:MAG TPA: HlyD family secretion protein [Syntrophomonadaceae bacterium]|nr:HlyD family secretion protein [Syntrophomonadaceae bacterium]
MSENQESAQVHLQGENVVPGGRRRVGIIVLIALVGLAAVGGLIWWDYANKVLSTDNAKVTGDIVAISPKVSGRLEQIPVKEEDHVQKDQIVAQLDLIPFKIALAQAQAALDQAQANYDKLPDDLKAADVAVVKAQEGLGYYQALAKSSELALADAERVFKENESLYNAGALSKEAMDASRTKLESAQAKLESDQANARVAQANLDDAVTKSDSAQKTSGNIYLAQLNQTRANLESAQYNYDNAIIKSPLGGTVVQVAVQAGENLTPAQTILYICDLDSTWISANIEEKDINRVKPGQKVDITIDAYPGMTLQGKVESVGGAAQSVFALIPSENTSGNFTKVTQRLPVKIIPDHNGLVLRPGMSAVIKIHTGQ